MEGATHERPHILWPHLYEMAKKGKLVERKQWLSGKMGTGEGAAVNKVQKPVSVECCETINLLKIIELHF